MWAEYFITVAFLFFLYLCLRWAFKSAIKLPRLPHKPVDFNGKGIETAPLISRIGHVREKLAQAKVPVRPAGFKRALRVEARRAEIASMAFFQVQPQQVPKPDDPEHGLYLILI